MSSKVIAGRYELLEKIGDGGMAVVYKAKCRLLNRFVAVKILKPEFVKDAKFVENFRKESHAAASLSHPNIVNVYDVGREGSINYIVMELVEGKTLSSVIKEEAPLPYKRVIELTKQIASGLSAAHKNNIIHRDVKPHNILLTEDGVAKITDFGIAKAVTSTTIVGNTSEAIMGSVHYFSPEQARGGYVDEKSDIYSLGIVMYEMLTGRVPFDGDNPVSVALMHINNDIIPPSRIVPGIPPRLEQIVMKATDKYQPNRFSSAEEMVDQLNNIEFVTRIVGNSAIEPERRRYEEENDEVAEELRKKVSNSGRKNGNSKKRMIIIIAIFLAVLGGLVAAGFATGILGKADIKVPDLRGMTYEEAEYKLDKLGLRIEEGDLVYSSKYEIGEVVSSDPEKGTMVKKRSVVTVNICKGAEEGTVPNLIGKKQTEAKQLIKKYGFKVGNITTKPGSEEEGTVIEQDPGAGEETKPGSYINLVLSDGSEKDKAEVPSLIGKSLDAAKQAIIDAGFKVGSVSYANSDSYGKGQVMWQQYEPSTKVKKGSSISIKVSKGSGTSTIAVDISYSKAKQEIFYLTVTVSDSNGTRTVISGEQRQKSDGGETVNISGTGSGTITVIFDDETVMTQKVTF